MSRLDSLQQHLSQSLPAASLYVVAFSGGKDSHVLLHALAALRDSLRVHLHAVHVHHGLHEYADDWANFCAQAASSLTVEFTQLDVSVQSDHQDGLEAAARQARYQVLEDWLPKGAALLTAHHQRDQAETLLLQLLRGAGPRGLAAMPGESRFGKGSLLRPFLDVPYAQIEEYADKHELDWVDDPSNEDTRFDRNLLRHTVMPVLRERWVGLDQVLSRAARHQASAMRLLDDMARIDLKGTRGFLADTLSVATLLGIPPYRRDNLIRYWIQARGLRLPSEAVLQRITPELLQARDDAMPCIQWDRAELRRYQDNLYLGEELKPVPAGWQQQLPAETMTLPAGGVLSPEPVTGKGIDASLLSSGRWQLAYRQGGERIKPVGSDHSRSLKQLLQERAIPPWIRERLPLIYCDDQLAGVAHLWVAEGFQAPEGKPGMLYNFDLAE